MSRKRWFLMALVGLAAAALVVSASALAQGSVTSGAGPVVPQDDHGDEVCDASGRGGALFGRFWVQGHGRGAWDMMKPDISMGPGAHGGLIALVAKELDVDVSNVVEALNQGNTLADFVVANDGDVTAIVNALIAQRQEVLDEAVASGRLSEEQAGAMIQHMREQVEEHLKGEIGMLCLGSGTPGAARFGRPGGHGGMRFGRF